MVWVWSLACIACIGAGFLLPEYRADFWLAALVCLVGETAAQKEKTPEKQAIDEIEKGVRKRMLEENSRILGELEKETRDLKHLSEENRHLIGRIYTLLRQERPDFDWRGEREDE